MTQRFTREWGPALAGLALVGLTACADNLPCDYMCTPAMWAAQEKADIRPVDYAEIFGREWVAGVSVDGQTATQHYPSREARADGRKP